MPCRRCVWVTSARRCAVEKRKEAVISAHRHACRALSSSPSAKMRRFLDASFGQMLIIIRRLLSTEADDRRYLHLTCRKERIRHRQVDHGDGVAKWRRSTGAMPMRHFCACRGGYAAMIVGPVILMPPTANCIFSAASAAAHQWRGQHR